MEPHRSAYTTTEALEHLCRGSSVFAHRQRSGRCAPRSLSKLRLGKMEVVLTRRVMQEHFRGGRTTRVRSLPCAGIKEGTAPVCLPVCSSCWTVLLCIADTFELRPTTSDTPAHSAPARGTAVLATATRVRKVLLRQRTVHHLPRHVCGVGWLARLGRRQAQACEDTAFGSCCGGPRRTNAAALARSASRMQTKPTHARLGWQCVGRYSITPAAQRWWYPLRHGAVPHVKRRRIPSAGHGLRGDGARARPVTAHLHRTRACVATRPTPCGQLGAVANCRCAPHRTTLCARCSRNKR